ncbi:hypothetical protein Tco_0610440, partial [Tanacetum coccineum]
NDYAGASLDKKPTTGGCQFLKSRLISWQCKKQTVVANSTTEAEYVATSNCYGHVLWIQNQLLDYGYKFMNTKIFNDNESTICIVKNPIFHSKTKHIEIRRHFIRDSNKKKLIQMIKIHTDQNVANLLTKAFDVIHLTFADSHNMVAYLEKLEANADFAEIVDFLNASPIRYALTERGDSVEKAVTTASSLDVEHDSGGRPRCQEAMGDTIAQTRVLDLENVKDAQALEIKKLKKRFKKLERKNKSRTLQLKRRVYKPRVESSKESLGKKDASKHGRNSDKTEELNVAEDEHMFDLSDLANTEVIADQEETIELVEDKGSAKKGVSTAEDKDSTVDPVTTAGEIVTTASVNPEDSTAVDASLADDVTFVETLIAIRCSALRPQKLKGVLFKEPSEPTTTSRPQPQILAKDKGKGIMEEPKKLVKVKGKDQIEYDADVAQRLQAELNKEVMLEREREEEASNAALIEEWDSIEARIDDDAQLAERLQAKEREQMSVEEQARLVRELIAARKNFFTAKRVEEQRNKPPAKAEQRKKMCTYMKHMAGYKDKIFKGKSFDAIKQMFDKAYKQVNVFVPMDTESSRKKAESSKKRTRAVFGEESVKRQKVEDDAEKAKLKACLEIVPGDDSAVNIESLASKYPILFSAMLNDFDRQDVLVLYMLVKERFETTSPEGYDRLLWGDLITLFELYEEDEI